MQEKCKNELSNIVFYRNWVYYQNMKKTILLSEKTITQDYLQGSLDEFDRGQSKRFKAIDERFTRVDKRFDEVNERFVQVDKRFEQVDKRFEQVDKRFIQVDQRFEKVEAKIEQLDKKIDTVKEGLIFYIDKRLEPFEEMRKDFYSFKDQVLTTLDWLVTAFKKFDEEHSSLHRKYELCDGRLDNHEHRLYVMEKKSTYGIKS